VHDAHAARPLRNDLVQELAERPGRLGLVQAVQIKLVFDAPVAAPELAQDVRRMPWPEKL